MPSSRITLCYRLWLNRSAAQDIKFIIHFDSIDPEDKREDGRIYQSANDAINKIKEVRPDIKTFSFDELLKMGQDSRDEIDIHPPSADDLSCIRYTSFHR